MEQRGEQLQTLAQTQLQRWGFFDVSTALCRIIHGDIRLVVRAAGGGGGRGDISIHATTNTCHRCSCGSSKHRYAGGGMAELVLRVELPKNEGLVLTGSFADGCMGGSLEHGTQQVNGPCGGMRSSGASGSLQLLHACLCTLKHHVCECMACAGWGV